jgi:hypothetical protein
MSAMFPVPVFFLPLFPLHTPLIFYYFLFTPAFLFQLFLPRMVGPEAASAIMVTVIVIDAILTVTE